MNNQQLQVYLRRILRELTQVYEQVEEALPDAKREQITRQRLKPEIQQKINERSKKNILYAAGINPEILSNENYEDYTVDGEIIALQPLSELIISLEEDLNILSGDNNDDGGDSDG